MRRRRFLLSLWCAGRRRGSLVRHEGGQYCNHAVGLFRSIRRADRHSRPLGPIPNRSSKDSPAQSQEPQSVRTTLIDVDSDFLFNLDGQDAQDHSALMTGPQRLRIRELFEHVGVADAAAQMRVVQELTGRQLQSPAEMLASQADTLIRALEFRIDSTNRPTGSGWSDRDEPTWIDKL